MATFTLIASSTVGSGGAASIDFTSIPSTYTDLCLKLSLRTTKTGSGAGLFMSINGVTTNRTWRWLYGTGSVTGSGSGSDDMIGNLTAASATANTFSNADIYIPNYAGSTNKSISVDSVDENNATAAFSNLSAVLWSNTAAITSLSFTPEANLFAQHSTAYLYGVSNA